MPKATTTPEFLTGHPDANGFGFDLEIKSPTGDTFTVQTLTDCSFQLTTGGETQPVAGTLRVRQLLRQLPGQGTTEMEKFEKWEEQIKTFFAEEDLDWYSDWA